MIKQNVKQLVAELTSVKAALAAAVDAEAGDIDAKVTAAWAELKADPKKTAVVVEALEVKCAIPSLKKYDEVINILKTSVDEVMTDDDINRSCECSLSVLRSVDRQMATLRSNLGIKRITIQRS